MADPSARFVISATTRKDIAEDLNEFAIEVGINAVVAPDDDRLTDELCANFAEQLHEISIGYATEDEQNEAEANLMSNTLMAMGVR